MIFTIDKVDQVDKVSRVLDTWMLGLSRWGVPGGGVLRGHGIGSNLPLQQVKLGKASV